MTNQYKATASSHLFSNLKKIGLFISLSLFLAVNAYSVSCPAKPDWCTDEGKNPSKDNDDICFYHSAAPTANENTETFNGKINAGSTVYVSKNTKLVLDGNGDYTGEIVNCGEMVFRQNISFGPGSQLINHGTIEDASDFDTKGKMIFINESDASFNSLAGLIISLESTVINYGDIVVNGELTVDKDSVLRNSGSIKIEGGQNFITNGILINSGTLLTGGFINFNSESKTVNNCTFIANGGFNSKGVSYTNNGNVFIGDNDASFAKELVTGPNSFIAGVKFRNEGNISGTGYFHFTGATTNTGDITSVNDGSANFVPMTFNKAIKTQDGTVTGVLYNKEFDVPARTDYAATCGQSVTFDLPMVEIDVITGDDIIDSSESTADVEVTGTTNVRDGQIVTVTVHGEDYTASVLNNAWSVSIPAADVLEFNSIEDVQAVASNVDLLVSSPDTRTITVEFGSVLIAVSIDDIAIDNNIDNDEFMNDLIISGTTSGISAIDLTLTIFGNTYPVVVEDGVWTQIIPAAVITKTPLSQTVSVSILDDSDNEITAQQVFTVSSFEPMIVITPVAGGNPINKENVGDTLIISGTSQHVEENQEATLTVLAVDYPEINIEADGTWSVEIPHNELLKFVDGEIVTVTVTTKDGVTDTDTIQVSITPVVICPVGDINCSTDTSCNVDDSCINQCPASSGICETIGFTCDELNNCGEIIETNPTSEASIEPGSVNEPAETIKIKTNLRGVGAVNISFLLLLSLMLGVILMLKAQSSNKGVVHAKF